MEHDEVPSRHTPLDGSEVPDIRKQRLAAARFNYLEKSSEWNDFTAGWWVAMCGTSLPEDETEPFKNGYESYKTSL